MIKKRGPRGEKGLEYDIDKLARLAARVDHPSRSRMGTQEKQALEDAGVLGVTPLDGSEGTQFRKESRAKDSQIKLPKGKPAASGRILLEAALNFDLANTRYIEFTDQSDEAQKAVARLSAHRLNKLKSAEQDLILCSFKPSREALLHLLTLTHGLKISSLDIDLFIAVAQEKSAARLTGGDISDDALLRAAKEKLHLIIKD